MIWWEPTTANKTHLLAPLRQNQRRRNKDDKQYHHKMMKQAAMGSHSHRHIHTQRRIYLFFLLNIYVCTMCKFGMNSIFVSFFKPSNKSACVCVFIWHFFLFCLLNSWGMMPLGSAACSECERNSVFFPMNINNLERDWINNEKQKQQQQKNLRRKNWKTQIFLYALRAHAHCDLKLRSTYYFNVNLCI